MRVGLSRRQFGASSLASSVGLAAAISGDRMLALAGADEVEANDEKDSRGWIDAHVHVWTPDTAAYPLDPSYTVADMQPPSFTPKELFAHCRPAGVTRVVLIQMSFYNFDNRYMIDMIAKYPSVFSGVGIVDHTAKDVADQMKRLASKGVRGFRLHARQGGAKSWVDDPGMARVWKTAGEQGLKVCPLINPSDLGFIDSLCKKFPETSVVIDHFARVGISGTVVPTELDALCGMAVHANVHVKTSAFYALGKKSPPYTDLKPMIRRVVDAFGPQRLMWASDCPYQVQGEHGYEASIALIRDSMDSLSASDKDWILRKTAEQVFFA